MSEKIFWKNTQYMGREGDGIRFSFIGVIKRVGTEYPLYYIEEKVEDTGALWRSNRFPDPGENYE